MALVSVQLRSVRRRRAQLRREGAGAHHPEDSGRGADRDVQMDPCFRGVPQNANGTDRAPGERVARTILLQQPAVDATKLRLYTTN